MFTYVFFCSGIITGIIVGAIIGMLPNESICSNRVEEFEVDET